MTTLLSPTSTLEEVSHLPRPEYPRPDFDRSDRWRSLNGDWQFETATGESTIAVPFAWETSASGVARTWLESARYRRTITVPADWNGARTFLCFGAVHHQATIALDGIVVGSHTGGYTSFEFDITDFIEPGTGSILTVDVVAPADKRSIPHGKQRSLPRDDYDGVSFTPSSGIWQSVWLEARGRTYTAEVAVRGDSLEYFELEIAVSGDSPASTEVAVRIGDDPEPTILITDARGRAAGVIRPRQVRLWSPRTPELYELELRVADDLVMVTAGLRSIERRGEELWLNGERLYLRGVLDQGYWQDSGITAPDDAALVRDIRLALDAGYNLVRKHLKFEEPRWLHWADRLGMLVWAEPASTSRFSLEAASAFEAQIAPMVARDGNHPSIVIWGLYNEEWGLDWDIPGDPEKVSAVRSAYDQLAALDRSRPIVDNSGWAHVHTDLIDWHYYDEKPDSWAANVAALAAGTREGFPVPLGPAYVVDKNIYADDTHPRRGVPMVNSEYGGGFTSLERGWHLRWQTQELRRHDRFAGYVYTELADVEHESAGLFTADRQPKDIGGLSPADANAETVVIVDLIPAQAGTDIDLPASDLTLTLRVSHHGPHELTGRIRAAWVPAGQPFGAAAVPADAETATVTVQPFIVCAPTELTVAPPTYRPNARLLLWLEDTSGKVRARTFVDAGPLEVVSAA